MEYNFIILSYWFHCSASSDSFNLVSYQCCALYLLSRSYRLVIVVVENLCFMPEWSCSYNHVNTHTQCSASLFVHFVFFLTVVFFFFSPFAVRKVDYLILCLQLSLFYLFTFLDSFKISFASLHVQQLSVDLFLTSWGKLTPIAF